MGALAERRGPHPFPTNDTGGGTLPVHTCEWSTLEETIKAAEKKGETIVQVVDGPRIYVITQPRPKRQYETRKRAT